MIINMNGAKAPETPSSVLQEKTVTPETLPTVIGPDAGYDGLTQVTVNPDAQLIPTNIRSGKTVFGVAGTFVGEETLVPSDTLYYAYTKDIYLGTSYSKYQKVSLTNKQVVLSSSSSMNQLGSVSEPAISWMSDNAATYIRNMKYSINSYSTESSYELRVTADKWEWSGITDMSIKSDNGYLAAGTPLSISVYYLPKLHLSYASQYGGVRIKRGDEPLYAETTGTLVYNYDPANAWTTFTITFNKPIVIENVDMVGYLTGYDSIMSSNVGDTIIYPEILKMRITW